MMRIYWGDARVMLHADDPRVAKILAMLVCSDLRPPPPTGVEKAYVPASDDEFFAIVTRYLHVRGHHG